MFVVYHNWQAYAVDASTADEARELFEDYARRVDLRDLDTAVVHAISKHVNTQVVEIDNAQAKIWVDATREINKTRTLMQRRLGR